MTFKEGKTQYSEKMVYSYISSSNLTAYLRTVYVLRCNDYEDQNEKVFKNVKGVCVYVCVLIQCILKLKRTVIQPCCVDYEIESYK